MAATRAATDRARPSASSACVHGVSRAGQSSQYERCRWGVAAPIGVLARPRDAIDDGHPPPLKIALGGRPAEQIAERVRRQREARAPRVDDRWPPSGVASEEGRAAECHVEEGEAVVRVRTARHLHVRGGAVSPARRGRGRACPGQSVMISRSSEREMGEERSEAGRGGRGAKKGFFRAKKPFFRGGGRTSDHCKPSAPYGPLG